MARDLQGFILNEEEPAIFEADLYVASMGRAGSTWLSNVLTMPPTHWVLTEPWFINGVFPKTIRVKSAEFGWPTDDGKWFLPAAERTHDNFLHRYRTFLAPQLARLSKWGVKEVRGDFHLPTIRTINPTRIIVLVRDMRDVVESLLEKWQRQGADENRGPEWIEQYCNAAAEALLELTNAHLEAQVRVVRYEDLIESKDALSELAGWLDWPMRGKPFSGLAEYGRGYEIGRHTGARENKVRILPEGAAAIVEKIAMQHGDYQAAYGYSGFPRQ